MDNINWLRQTPDKPLFPDTLWSRPENRRHAGKLLIIGGHQQSFNDVSLTYASAEQAGSGTIRLVLPDKLQRMLAKILPEAEFAPSTPIGSFSQQALDTLLELSHWSDSVLLAGDFGHNSETAILLDNFVGKHQGQVTITGDSINYFYKKPSKIVDRPNTMIIAHLMAIQKIAQPSLINQNADFLKIINQLANWSKLIQANIVTLTSNQVIVASNGQISATFTNKQMQVSQLAAYAAVWAMQQPDKVFESLTTAVYEFIA